ncbi:MAG TPA: DegT/DnrJ/EryC1/StrS family aminotransferase [Bryobacteraceae bacterium]|nr:DegT/DnrJ/EryC1/StrS family aminotransferase [Bryobacteraceae bacterium]
MLRDALYSNRWTRIQGDKVVAFEKRWGKMLGIKYCFATNAGTTALDCAVRGIRIQPGDEVLVPSFASLPVSTMPFNCNALPVFVEPEQQTFGIDPSRLEEKITEHTKAIIAVHWGGQPCDMDGILAAARKHNLRVIEDSCQAPLAEWNGKKTGTLGDVGCFSHQASKGLPCGEGGSIASDNEEIISRSYSWHDYGRMPNWATHKPAVTREWLHYGMNYKMSEFQGAILLSELDLLEEQINQRWENARYLDELLTGVPGFSPQKLFPQTTKSAHYLYCARYDSKYFHDLPRAKFLKAINAEGIPMGDAMDPVLHKEPFVEEMLNSPYMTAVFSKERIDRYRKMIRCPAAEKLASEVVHLPGPVLLSGKSNMDAIAEAIRKVQAYSAQLL